jgi:mono/diheme cytochrome c family protein
MKRFLRLSAVLGLMSSCGSTVDGGSSADAGPLSRDQQIAKLIGDVAKGGTIYADTAKTGCAGCHGADGKSTAFKVLTVSVTTKTVAELAAFIIKGKGVMQAYGTVLNDQELADVVAWMKGNIK